MIDWPTIRPALMTLIADLSGLQVDMIDSSRTFMDPAAQARVFLSEPSQEEQGQPDRRWTDDGQPIPATNMIETLAGQTQVRLDVRVESLRHGDDKFAHYICDKIRTGLSFRSSNDRLGVMNVALVERSRVVKIPNITKDQRITSAAAIELTLNISYATADTANPRTSIDVINDPTGTLTAFGA